MSKMGYRNVRLTKAKKSKNDEFYTKLIDIEKELMHYKKHFKGKIIYCNCDNPKESNFFKYFTLNFKPLGIKKLITTHYNKGGTSYKLEYIDGKSIKTPLKGDGDFRSNECISILKNVDIVITNPPFSLFMEYIAQLIEYNKQFLILGNLNAVTFRIVFKNIIENKIKLGYNILTEFIAPNGDIKRGAPTVWYTNLDIKKRYKDITLYKLYNEIEYPKYDNYDAINVDRVKEIPMDYAGYMGVPISFVTKHNPKQFEILGITGIKDESGGIHYKNAKSIHALINGVKKYRRVFIKNKRL